MSHFLPRLVSPTALLYIFLSLSHVAQGVYSAGDIEPPPGFTLIYSAGFLWIVGWWLLTDSRKRGITCIVRGHGSRLGAGGAEGGAAGAAADCSGASAAK